MGIWVEFSFVGIVLRWRLGTFAEMLGGKSDVAILAGFRHLSFGNEVIEMLGTSRD